MGGISSYQKRIIERDKFKSWLDKLQRKVWELQENAMNGIMMGKPISPYNDMCGSEEGVRMNEDELRKEILDIKIFE